MVVALEASMPAGTTWTQPDGGFFTWVTADATVDSVALAPIATAAGVAYVPGTAFYPDARGRHEMRLSFSRATEDQLEEGARRLGAVLYAATDVATGASR
jgi:DNA-binding transcriptional MocR family regulator